MTGPLELSGMPRYKCHKTVWALRIAEVNQMAFASEPEDGGRVIVPAEQRFKPFKVSAEYVRKHDPQAGGYFVVYEDGYQSYSPAGPFESGYTLVNDALELGAATRAEGPY